MLKKLIENRILFIEKASSWEEAIRIGGASLVEQGICTQGYIDTTIDSVKEFGPYIVLCDGVAMPHTRPENGGLKMGMSFLSLGEGITFPDTEAPVRLLFTLSATDSDGHIDALMQLADIVGDEDSLKNLLNCKNQQDFLNIISK
ncbi:MAG: PTS sugar transporter subunit IIA [Brevinema sp.]